MLNIVPVRAFTDNYIWIIHNHRHAAVVDPGDAVPVLDFLRHEDLQLVAILNTHHHNDHVGGNAALLKEFSVPVYGPAQESIPTVTHPLSEGDSVHLVELALALKVIDIPGHTAGHIAYYGANLLFCGDTLFACGCGRLFEGTAQQMYSSLQKLAILPDATQVYCGHEYTLANIHFAKAVEPGNPALSKLESEMKSLLAQGIPTLPSTIIRENATNPFLRCNQLEIIQSAGSYVGSSLTDPVSIFAAIRNWKNDFVTPRREQ
ncbi:hydroxyacylglutathione hydrolase [Nitrosomonadaceae bacterium]|nr:hydroxyacylglutathione hydrolase [Nitrosomonadaceae bacterium]